MEVILTTRATIEKAASDAIEFTTKYDAAKTTRPIDSGWWVKKEDFDAAVKAMAQEIIEKRP